MSQSPAPALLRSRIVAIAAAVCAAGATAPASAQSEGGLYIAGYGFSFQETGARDLAESRRAAILSAVDPAADQRADGDGRAPARRGA